MDRVGLAAALFDEGEAERGAAAAHQALDDAARVDSTLVASRLNTLLDAARPYETAAVRRRTYQGAGSRRRPADHRSRPETIERMGKHSRRLLRRKECTTIADKTAPPALDLLMRD